MEMRTCNRPAEPKSKHSRSTPPPSRTPLICCAAFEPADEGFLRTSRGKVPSGHQRRAVRQKSLPWYHKRVEGSVPANYSPQRHQTIGKLLDSRGRSSRKGPSPNLSHASPAAINVVCARPESVITRPTLPNGVGLSCVLRLPYFVPGPPYYRDPRSSENHNSHQGCFQGCPLPSTCSFPPDCNT